MSDVWAIALASLMGSAHCLGMCGGLATLASSQPQSTTGPTAQPRLPRQTGLARRGPLLGYHLARLAGYVGMGAVAGGLGSGVQRAGVLLGVAHAAALSAGALLVVWGAALLVRRSAPTRLVQLRAAPKGGAAHEKNNEPGSALEAGPRRFGPGRWLGQCTASLARRAAQQRPMPRAIGLGLSSALLPCGWLWAFALSAAATGSAASGALTMLAFWSGTLPLLLGFGLVLGGLLHRVRRQLPRLAGAALLGLGLYNVTTRWPSFTTPATNTPMNCHAHAGQQR